MTTRSIPPSSAPTWADLWTSDVAAARAFYGGLFGWEATEPAPEFGGYFKFTKDGVAVAGAMGDMFDMPATNTWKAYLATDDIDKTLSVAQAAGAAVMYPAMAVGTLGKQALITDPSGAPIGLWQPADFVGFTVLDEPGTPSWFELHTRDHARSLEFYRSVFGWDVDYVANTDEFRYAVVHNPTGGADLAGVMDSTPFSAPGDAAYWDVYWQVDDIDDSLLRLQKLGGSVQMGPDYTPYGQLAVCTDPLGAGFKLRVPPRG